jgi:hypothetical protein
VNHSTFPLLIAAMLGAAVPTIAQQTSSQAPASSAAPSSSSAPASSSSDAQPAAAKSGPSDETLKRAKSAGLKPETHNGKTMFCWEDASIGSRFTTKKCTDEAGLDDIITQREAAKSNMRQSMTGTSSH